MKISRKDRKGGKARKGQKKSFAFLATFARDFARGASSPTLVGRATRLKPALPKP
jgi:hypothetical protein